MSGSSTRIEPSADQVAAIVAILAAARGTPVPEKAPVTKPSAWRGRGGAIRPPVHPGPGAWRASAFPG